MLATKAGKDGREQVYDKSHGNNDIWIQRLSKTTKSRTSTTKRSNKQPGKSTLDKALESL